MSDWGPSGTAIDDPLACSAAHPSSEIIRDLLSRVGDKWSMLVIAMLDAKGPIRFTELQRSIVGISHRMLTQTLRALERDGLVLRTSYPEIPPRVEYAVTDLGRSLATPVKALVEWAEAHHDAISESRDRFDER